MAYLEVRQASRRFGSVSAVENVSIAIEKGERFGILGQSGSGKTTLLRLIAGLLDLHAGSIVLENETISESGRTLPPEQRRLGMIFQSLGLWPHLTVEQHLALVLRANQPNALARDLQRHLLLEWTQLAGKEARLPGQLSGGERQRLALARALAPQPRLLLLDEPFAHVDEPLRDELSAVLVAVLESCNATSIIVSHDGQHLAALCHRIAVMESGQVLQQGPFEALYRQPQTPAVARLTGAAFLLEGQANNLVAETAIGKLPLAHQSLGKGWLCLRPESFTLRKSDVGATSLAATITRSVFIAGRWKIHFKINEHEFWTWSEEAGDAGQATAVQISAAAFIASNARG